MRHKFFCFEPHDPLVAVCSGNTGWRHYRSPSGPCKERPSAYMRPRISPINWRDRPEFEDHDTISRQQNKAILPGFSTASPAKFGSAAFCSVSGPNAHSPTITMRTIRLIPDDPIILRSYS